MTTFSYSSAARRCERAASLRLHPPCARPGYGAPAVHVDHVLPIVGIVKVDPWDRTNWEALCASCQPQDAGASTSFDTSLLCGEAVVDQVGRLGRATPRGEPLAHRSATAQVGLPLFVRVGGCRDALGGVNRVHD